MPFLSAGRLGSRPFRLRPRTLSHIVWKDEPNGRYGRAQRAQQVLWDLHVLKDIDITLREGEKPVTGPWGSGKPALIRRVDYLEEATSGEFRISGELVTKKNRLETMRDFIWRAGMRAVSDLDGKVSGASQRSTTQGNIGKMLEGSPDPGRRSLASGNMDAFWEGPGVTLQAVVAGPALSLCISMPVSKSCAVSGASAGSGGPSWPRLGREGCIEGIAAAYRAELAQLGAQEDAAALAADPAPAEATAEPIIDVEAAGDERPPIGQAPLSSRSAAS